MYTIFDLEEIIDSGATLSQLIERFALDPEEVERLERLEPRTMYTLGAYSFRREY